MLKNILQFILKFSAILVLKKYKPLTIAITGSVGKTSTKEAIYCILRAHFTENKVRRSLKNYNNEIGVPLTILGCDTVGRSLFGWLAVFVKVIRLILMRDNDYPSMLILEMGADRPGDIRYLANFVKPDIAVITAIGEVPVHVEFFENPAYVAREKAILAQALKKDGFLILNNDDEAVRRVRDKAVVASKVITYGLGAGADVRAVNIDLSQVLSKDSSPRSDQVGAGGINFKIDYQGKIVPLRLVGLLGKHQIYALLAAICVGLRFNMNLLEIVEALADYVSPPGRMKLLKGIKHSWIIDDTYNASPLAMGEALTTVGEINIVSGAKKIVVLGDMLELGQFTEREHRKTAKQAIKIADYVVTVGARANFIAEQAKESGFLADHIFAFDMADEAKLTVQEIIQENDLILVKGSQSMRLEKIVEEIMAEPLRAKELLVRQDAGWRGK